MADLTLDQIPTTYADASSGDILVGKRPDDVTFQTTVGGLPFQDSCLTIAPIGGGVGLDAGLKQARSFITDLNQDLNVLSISNIRSDGATRLTWYIRVIGADRQIPANIFPGGAVFSSIWKETLAQGETRVVELHYLDGVATLITHNSPLELDASDIITGTFASGRISAASVRQHLYMTDSPVSDGHALSTTDNTNGNSLRKTLVFTGTTNTLNVDTGLGAYSANSPFIFLLQNDGSGALTVSGTATINVSSGKTAVVSAGGIASLKQTATDVYRLDGDLVLA